MSKLTFKKIAELTLQKVGHPLTTKEIWSKAIELGICESSFSSGKTPDQTIGAYLYWSLRDEEGVFTKIEGKPVKFGLVLFSDKISPPPGYFIVGTTYEHGSVYDIMIERNMISTGYCWERNLTDLYGKPEWEIIEGLKNEGRIQREYTAIKKFLQIKPGDIIALKGKGWPSGGRACLEILGYAMVVEREGQVYFHDPGGLGHGIHVEYIEQGIKIDKERGGYGSNIHSIRDVNTIEHIFGDYTSSKSEVVRDRIRVRRKEKGTNVRRKGTENRSGTKPYVAHLTHNEIQERFYKALKIEFPMDRVTMEEDFVDVKRENENEIILYEVKPYYWAEDCICEALGQLISYAHKTTLGNKALKLVVVGPSEITKEEKMILDYIQKNLRIDFSYSSFW